MLEMPNSPRKCIELDRRRMGTGQPQRREGSRPHEAACEEDGLPKDREGRWIPNTEDDVATLRQCVKGTFRLAHR